MTRPPINDTRHSQVESLVQGKTVLVSGGAGFIGSYTAKALAALGANVIVVDDLSTGHRDNVPDSCTFHELDVASAAFEELLDRTEPDVIYHFAYHVRVPQSVEDPMVELPSLAGVLRLLRYARRKPPHRIVFASTGFIYGNGGTIPLTEESPFDPASPYAISKFTAEQHFNLERRLFNVPSVLLRYPAVYGPGQVTGALADYVRSMHDGHQTDMYGADKTRDYIFIDDVVRANLLALTVSPEHPDPVFNVATGVETSLLDAYHKVAAFLGRDAEPIMHPPRPGEQVRYALSWQKFHAATGWRPRISFEVGLRAVIDHAPSGAPHTTSGADPEYPQEVTK